MKKQSQLQWIKSQLENKGFVTRNDALRKYISRLAARIADLREAGWNIEGERMKNGNYKYTLMQ